MLQYFTELLNVLMPCYGGLLIVLFPMWKTRNASNRFVLVSVIGLSLIISAALAVTKQYVDLDDGSIQTFRFITWISLIIPFLVFRKRVWQNIFLNVIGLTVALVWMGTGTYVGVNWFADNLLLAANIVTFFVIAVTLPPLLYLLRRLCGNLEMKQAIKFWRFAWLVPAVLFIIIMVTSTYFGGGVLSSDFIVVRVLIYAILLCICYLFDIAVRQISEAEAAKRAAEEAAAKTDFYRRMSHSMRTPLTKVSTNIQTAKRRPDEAEMLLTKSQGEIMKMAGMISDALKDGDKGAGE